MAAPKPSDFTKLPYEYTIATPSDTMALPIYMSTWTRIKQQVRECRRGVSFWGMLFPTLLGVALSSIVPAILDFKAQPKDTPLALTWWMLVFLLSGVAVLLSFKAYRDALNHEAQSIQSIVSEMEELQSRFTRGG